MKMFQWSVAVVLTAATAGLAPLATASTGLYSSEPAAQQACQSDEVVWIDLDHGRFYHKAQAKFGQGSNGGYACLKAAHAQYRESHE